MSISIIPFLGRGIITSHTPADINKIPHETIKKYSPNMDLSGAEYYTELVLRRDNNDEFYASLILSGNGWSKDAKEKMAEGRFDYDSASNTLVGKMEIGPDWHIGRFEISHKQVGKKHIWTDVLEWYQVGAEENVFKTGYTWER